MCKCNPQPIFPIHCTVPNIAFCNELEILFLLTWTQLDIDNNFYIFPVHQLYSHFDNGYKCIYSLFIGSTLTFIGLRIGWHSSICFLIKQKQKILSIFNESDFMGKLDRSPPKLQQRVKGLPLCMEIMQNFRPSLQKTL